MKHWKITIEVIVEDEADEEEIAEEVRHVADLIDEDYQSGFLNNRGHWECEEVAS